MDRIDSILEYIETKFDEKVLENKEEINTQFLENKEQIKEEFFNKIINLIVKKVDTNPIYIIISPLKSSLITKKYELVLGCYDENLYLDKEAIYEYFSIKCLFKSVEKDIDYIKKEINKEFVRFLDFELKEIILKYEYKYMEMYLDYVKELLNEIDKLEIDKKVIILYGEYMEKAFVLKEIN